MALMLLLPCVFKRHNIKFVESHFFYFSVISFLLQNMKKVSFKFSLISVL